MDLIIVGSQCGDIKKFLEKNISMQVLGAYSSMDKMRQETQTSILHINKLVLIPRSTSELSVMIRHIVALLETSTTFFKTEEISFIFKVTEIDVQEVQEVLNILNKFSEAKKLELKVQSYELHALEYDLIAKSILGQVESVTYNVKKVYRFLAEIDGDDSITFSPSDEQGCYKVKDLTDIKKYADASLLSANSEDRRNIPLEALEVPKLAAFNVENYKIPELNELNIYIVSGYENTGASIYSCAIASSFVELESTVVMIDISSSYMAGDYLEGTATRHTGYEDMEYLKAEQRYGINLFYSTNYALRFKYLLAVLEIVRKKLRAVKTIIVNCDIADMEFTENNLAFVPHRTLVSCNTLKGSIKKLGRDLLRWNIDFIWLNDQISDTVLSDSLTIDEINDMINMMSDNTEVLEPIEFEDFEIDKSLAEILMGV